VDDIYLAKNSKDASKVFAKLGFVLLKNFALDPFVDLLKDESNQLIDLCINGPISKRMQLNPNYYIGKYPSIWGINDFLCDFLIDTKRELVKSLLSVTSEITLEQGLNKLSLNRIHFQRRKFIHKLFWHHDCHDFKSNFVVNLYLENETGFRITDKLNKINSKSDHKFGRGGMYFSLFDDYYTISAEPGDLLIFDGRLLHQPYNKFSRMHLHFVFQNHVHRSHQSQLFNENACLDRNKELAISINSKIYSKIKYLLQSFLDNFSK